MLGSLSASPNSLVADGASTTVLTSSWTDSLGHPLTGIPITFSSSNGNVTFTPNPAVTNCSGTARSVAAANAAALVTLYAGPGNLHLAHTQVNFTCPGVFLSFKIVPSCNGYSIYALALSDMNNDGNLDALITSPTNMQILLGHGTGDFQLSSVSTTNVNNAGLNIYGIAVADFNGDGNNDVATANPSTNTVSVLLGLGTGSLQAAVNYSTLGSLPQAIVAGLIDSDSAVDLAVLNSNSNSLSVLLNNGSGSFVNASVYSVGNAPLALALGDFNRDGSQDMVIANNGSSSLSILLGSRTGSFTAGLSYSVTNPNSVVVNDFNKDNKLDVASNNTTTGISVFLGLGNGSFASVVNYSGFTGGNNILTADFNGDGNQDLAQSFGSATSGANLIGVLYGNGDGTFQPKQTTTTAGSGTNVITRGDVNNDGLPDLLISNFYDNSLSILLASKTGGLKFVNNPLYTSYNTGPEHVVIADLNNDGHADLTVSNYEAQNLMLFRGNGDGTFNPNYVTLGSGFHRAFSAVADVNQDGNMDIVALSTQSNLVTILLGIGGGNFAAGVNYSVGSNPEQVAVKDFNQDGIADLGITSLSDSKIYLLTGIGNGTFHAAVGFSTGTNPTTMLSPDMNNDGKPDWVSVNSSNFSILLNQGSGVFAAPVNYTTPYTTLYAGATADFNLDGNADLVISSSSNTSFVFLGQGNGSVVYNGSKVGNISLDYVTAADVDGDGKPDFLGGDSGATIYNVFLGYGDGTFKTHLNSLTAFRFDWLAVGDVNGDGRADLAGVTLTSNVGVALNAACD